MSASMMLRHRDGRYFRHLLVLRRRNDRFVNSFMALHLALGMIEQRLRTEAMVSVDCDDEIERSEIELAFCNQYE